ncbi:hypothetical protein N7456_005008 [Penicillium angulare]|uniref:BTB domain-containing protein n=1 Tax=Penicillium angulare TaxID=116970 RepID=A0A9W9FXS8_9EURO|nr:hypothetical protein N7456_005008 [Penicillium angulare]
MQLIYHTSAYFGFLSSPFAPLPVLSSSSSSENSAIPIFKPWLDSKTFHRAAHVPEIPAQGEELSPKENKSIKMKKITKRRSSLIPSAHELGSPTEETVSEEAPAEETAPDALVDEDATTKSDTPESEDDSCFRIQVSSKHLMLSSPVFKKILTDDGKESPTDPQKGPGEIDAENWDIEAFVILLRAIHGQYYQIPRVLTLEMLAKVAFIANHYECKETLDLLKDVWVENMEDRDKLTFLTALRNCILWLWVAWFFQLPSQFKLSTSFIMSKSDDRIDVLGLPIYKTVIKLGLEDLTEILYGTRDAFLNGWRGCCRECSSIMYGALTIHIWSNNLPSSMPEPPFFNLEYNFIMQKIMEFESLKWYDANSSTYAHREMHECCDSSLVNMTTMPPEFVDGLELKRFSYEKVPPFKVSPM